MIVRLPSPKTRQWLGPYLDDYIGNLWRTFNVDLERNPGHITISKSPVVRGDTTDTNLLNLTTIDAFTRTNADGTDRWWALNRSGRLAKTDTVNPTTLASATWDEDTLASSPTDARDMTIHENDSDSASGENQLIVTRDTALAMLNDTATNVWNANWGGLTLKSGVPHPIEYFPFQRLTLVGDGHLIHTVDKNRAVVTARLVLPLDLEVWGIFFTPFRAWILCSGLRGRSGAVVEWDGYSQSPNHIHNIPGIRPQSGVNLYGVPIVVNNHGLFFEYDGSSFSPMIRYGQEIAFPFYKEPGNTFAFRGIPARGMAVGDNGLIYINTEESTNISRRHSAGVWCLNPDKRRLYLKHSLNMGGDTDYGQQVIGGYGAASSGAAVKFANNPGSGEELLIGGRFFTDYATVVKSAIWLLNNTHSGTARRGFFITQFIPSEEMQEMWDIIWTELSAFRDSGDRVVIKARGVNQLLDDSRFPLEETITWTSTTTFTVTLAAGDDSLSVGDEVEIRAGVNSGALAHITTISGAHAAIQTITIDETLANGSGGSLCRFDRWKKLGVIDSATKYFVPTNIGISSSFVQFKIEMRGPANDFDIKSLTVSSKKQVKSIK